MFNDSPFMESIIVLITLLFFVCAWTFGRGARTITSTNAAIAAITKTLGGLATLIFIFVLIAQFLAYFNYSNISRVLAVGLADLL